MKKTMLSLSTMLSFIACGAPPESTEETTSTSQAIAHVATIPFAGLAGGYTELYFGFHSGTHKNPVYSACTNTQAVVPPNGATEGSCLNDMFRASGSASDINSFTADYAALWATASGGDNCRDAGGCLIQIPLQPAKNGTFPDQWLHIVPSGFAMTVGIAASVNQANTEEIGLSVFSVQGNTTLAETWVIPNDGLGHFHTWSLPTNPNTALPWSKSDLTLARTWSVRSEREVSPSRPGGVFIQSFTAYVWYATNP